MANRTPNKKKSMMKDIKQKEQFTQFIIISSKNYIEQ